MTLPLRSALTALATLSSLAVLAPLAAAQPTELASIRRPPVIFIEPERPDTAPIKLGVERAQIEARIVGHLAETRLTLTFGNTSSRRMAGDLYVPLPPDATVSGYALDVAGRMVDGVVVGKDEARRIFEKEVRKGVDPGLVEWTRGNVFKTRVFPIPPNGSRTVMLRWVAPLEAGKDGPEYALPLAFTEKLSSLSVRVEVVRGKDRPIVTGKGPLELRFDDRLVAEAKLTDQAVVQDLRIRIPDVERRPVQVERAADGRTYFAIRDLVPAPADLPAIKAKTVRVVWDASLSRERSDLKRELAFLERYLATLSPDAEVELVTLRNAPSAPKLYKVSEAARLLKDLAATPLDGGTQLARLAPPAGARAVDLVLVFTDGFSTFGDDTPTSLGAPTWFLSSSTEAAFDGLTKLAAENGGVHLDLTRVSNEAALARVGRPTWSLLSVVVADGQVDELTPKSVSPALGASFATGVLASARATLRLSWGVPGQAASVVKTYEVVAPEAATSTGEVLHFFWARRVLGDLLADPKKNADDIVDLGKRHGIVTPGTSLLVLETLAQYLEHRVRPPASWPEMRKDWDREIETQKVAQQRTEAARLDEVAQAWGAEVAWYERRFEYPANFRYRDPENSKSESRASGRAFAARDSAGMIDGLAQNQPAPPPSPAAEAREEERPEPSKSKKADKDGGGDDANTPEPGVALTPWDPKTPWTIALKAAAPDQRFAVYLAQRKDHGSAPSFYLDCSDVFLGFKDRATALQILSNIAELRLDDPALLRVLAHRLAQLDELSTAATIFAEVLRLRPEEPQSHRDLALTLARRAQTNPANARADYTAALDHLAQLIKTKWDRFDGIELIALYEYNNILDGAKRAGLTKSPLDDRFIKPMQLDVRIAMTWDADATDMDLHVLEPSREEAYYSHNLTTIGGKVSRDFTQGYGPEVYTVKTAMKGTYKVKTKFYGSSAASLIGAVTLQIDVFTNWGRPNEKRQSMTLRLTEAKEDFLVGEIEF